MRAPETVKFLLLPRQPRNPRKFGLSLGSSPNADLKVGATLAAPPETRVLRPKPACLLRARSI
jgi:hypothetical protein